jgi:hypothetical protein
VNDCSSTNHAKPLVRVLNGQRHAIQPPLDGLGEKPEK